MVTVTSSVGKKSRDVLDKDRDAIALVYNTLPRFVGNISADGTFDLFDEFVEPRDDDIDFNIFYEKVSPLFPELSRKEILERWLTNKRALLDDGALTYYVQLQVNDVLDVDTFIRHDVDEYVQRLQHEIAVFAKTAQEKAANLRKLQTGIPHTQFFKKSKTYRLSTDADVPLPVLFDNFTPSRALPFASYAGMYKYAKTFTPQPGMDVSSPDTIILVRLDLRRNETSNVFVYLTPAGTVNCEFEGSVVENDGEIIALLVLESLNIEANPRVVQIGVQGSYFFIGYTIDRYIFPEFVMNNAAVSSQISLGEFTVPSRTGPTRVYFPAKQVTGTIASKTVTVGTSDYTHVSHLASVGDPYIRLFVSRAATDSDAADFVDTIARILHAYTGDYDVLYKIYKTYIPGFPRTNLDRQFTAPSVRGLDPAIFVPNYSRVCPHIPTPANADSDGAIEFPKGSGQWYVCTDSEYKYPGVRENTLPNSDTYPYIPCCFKTDQRTKPKFRKYYMEDEEQTLQIRLITTDKVLAPDFFGVLPPLINELFLSLDPDNVYVRYGVSDTLQSFIDCVSLATGRRMVRARIPSVVNIALCAQENPGLLISEIEASVKDPSTYFSPRRYIRLLEEVFAVNIYIFDKDGIVVPNHVHGYYRYARKPRPTIIVYEHLTTQRCELVSRWDQDTDEYSHTQTANFTHFLEQVLADTVSTWIGGARLQPISEPSFFEKCVAQYVDMYGKTRGLKLVDETGEVYVDTTPLPPLNIPLTHKIYASAPDSQQIIDRIVGQYTPVGWKMTLPIHNTHEIERGIANIRTAKYLCEVFIFLYSTWSHSTGDTAIERFVNDRVVVVPDYVYKIDGPSTSDIRGVLYDNKFAAQSRRMLERLVFVLERAIQQNRTRVDTYYAAKYFVDYYSSIDSFRRGDFMLTPSIVFAQAQNELEIYNQPVDQSAYVITVGDVLYDAAPAVYNADSKIIAFNSPDDVSVLGGSAPPLLAYKQNGKVRYMQLTRVIN